MILVTYNGQPKKISKEMTLLQFLTQEKYEGKGFAVAVNKAFIAREAYSRYAIQNGDSIEVVGPMQGG